MIANMVRFCGAEDLSGYRVYRKEKIQALGQGCHWWVNYEERIQRLKGYGISRPLSRDRIMNFGLRVRNTDRRRQEAARQFEERSGTRYPTGEA